MLKQARSNSRQFVWDTMRSVEELGRIRMRAMQACAFVIVALAPLIVRILPKVGIKPLIFVGYLIFASAMWSYASIDLRTDYKHVALLRALQGLGIAPLFVPVSQLAYSFLPKNKNNKASSIHQQAAFL
jgi:MFS family permease